MQISRCVRTLAVGAGVGIGLLATSATASAHVSIAEGEVAAGSYAVLTFGLGHGCAGSPTTEVRIQIPESIPTPTPTINANWDVEKVTEALETPMEAGHGTTIEERVAEVVYTAKTPLLDGFRDTFELSVSVPEDAADETIYFPTVQTCEEGVTRWIEIPADGEDPHDLEAPSPQVVVIAADDDGHGHGDPDADAEGHDDGADDDSSSDGGTDTVAWIALVAGVLGLGAGGFALARKR